MMTKILVWGVGYVGMVTAAAFAHAGFDVQVYDIDDEKLHKITQGQSPIYEPGIQEIVETGKITARFHTKDIEPTDFIFVCVGTPSNEDGSINTDYVMQSAEDIGRFIAYRDVYPIIVLKSTVLPGTTRKFIEVIKQARKGYPYKIGKDFGVIYSPEFLREGTALLDTLFPDKLVIGYDPAHKHDADTFNALYVELFARTSRPYLKDTDYNVIRTNYENAEMIKYANNAFLATKISFINEIANICEVIPGTDVNVIAEAIGYDYRIAPAFLRAGLGFGGSCFTKDIKALITRSESGKDPLSWVDSSDFYTPEVLKATLSVNDMQRRWVLGALIDVFYPDDFQDKTIAVLGLAFKPNTDDVRDSPALDIIQELLDWGVKRVNAYDPKAMDNAKKVLPELIDEDFNGLLYYRNTKACIDNADAVIIATEWDEFKEILDPKELLDFRKNKNPPIIIDGRRMLSPEEILRMKSFGIKYIGVGLGNDINEED